MRITIITSPFSFLPPQGIGAIEKRWFYVGHEFAEQGHDVTFIHKRSNPPPERGLPNVHFRGIPGFGRTGFRAADIVLDLFYSLRAIWVLQETDILILNTFWTPLLCLFARRKYRRSVYNVARMPKGQYRFFGHVDRLACVSKAVAEELIRQTPQRAPLVRVINNPINTGAFRFQQPADPASRVNICFTGRLHPEKGLSLLVQSYALLKRRFPELSLTLVGASSIHDGGGGEAFLDQLRKLVGDCPIEWVSPVSDPYALADVIARCDIFCYPSISERGESFGVAPLEAMATGRPVVVSALECFREFIRHDHTGLVFDHRGATPHLALAHELERLIIDPELRHLLGRQGSALAHSHFSVQAIAAQYLDDFGSLLAAPDHA